MTECFLTFRVLASSPFTNTNVTQLLLTACQLKNPNSQPCSWMGLGFHLHPYTHLYLHLYLHLSPPALICTVVTPCPFQLSLNICGGVKLWSETTPWSLFQLPLGPRSDYSLVPGPTSSWSQVLLPLGPWSDYPVVPGPTIPWSKVRIPLGPRSDYPSVPGPTTPWSMVQLPFGPWFFLT